MRARFFAGWLDMRASESLPSMCDWQAREVRANEDGPINRQDAKVEPPAQLDHRAHTGSGSAIEVQRVLGLGFLS